MRISKIRRFSVARLFLGILLLSATAVAFPQGMPNFSGLWKQDNNRCQPQRKGDVSLSIKHHDPELTVETTIARSSGSTRHALQHYSTDGSVSISTGADGDEFHTSIHWQDQSLVFSVDEHEDGRILRSEETWTLIEGGTTLQRVRRNKEDTQTLFYVRQPQA